jgi:hypothetical protein
VKTGEAVVHAKQGIIATGLGTNVPARDAMCPPIDTPVTARGPNPIFSHQFNNTDVSTIKAQPITNKSTT